MKTRKKLAFIDQNGDQLTVYPIKPIKDKVKEFRKQELATIKEEDQLYRAFARETGTWHETHYLSPSKLAKLEDDTFTARKIGYENPYDKKAYPKYEYWCDDPKHILRRSDPYYRHNLDEYLTAYLDGGMNDVPFRVITDTKDGEVIQNFLPMTYYVGPDMNDPRDHYAVMRGILHISDMAYLEQLLRCNSISILAARTASLDGSLERILGLFSFGKPRTFDINEVKKGEELIQNAHQLLYGDKIFHREAPLDPEQTEKERRPVSKDLLEQAEIDKPLIEQVKMYIKKR